VIDTAPGATGRPGAPDYRARPERAMLAAARSGAVASVGELRALREQQQDCPPGSGGRLGADFPVEFAGGFGGEFAGEFTNAPASARLARTALPRIQRRLREQLPDSLLPGSLTAVRRWPADGDGVIDAARLPRPLPSAAELAPRPIPPRTDTERAIAEIWATVLEVDGVGVNQDFFALGGHSLLGTQVIDQVQGRFGVELPLARLFESSTVAAVADFVDERLRSADRPGSGPIRRIDRSAVRRPVRTEPGNG
jgi:acyl carrier protein